MTFAEPLWMAAGAAVALLVAVGLVSHARRRRVAADFLGGARAARRLSGPDLMRTPAVRILLLGLAAAAAGMAAAEPRWIDEPEAPDEAEPSVVLAVDVSGSMQAADVEPTRLGRGVEVARDLLAGLEGRRVGLLLFAGKPYVLAPPTRDHAVLAHLLEGVEPDVVSLEDPGTLISEALEGAAVLLSDSADVGRLRSVVLLGDGESGEEPVSTTAAARALADDGVRVHAVGVGTPAGSEVVLPVGYQRGGRLTDAAGAPVVSTLREDDLRRLVRAGGGRYARADDPDALRALARELGAPASRPSPDAGPVAGDGGAAASDGAGAAASGGRPDPGVWAMSAALLLLLVESLLDVRLPGRGRRSLGRVPFGPERRVRRTGAARAAALGLLSAAVVLAGLLLALDRRSPERGNRLYRAGEVERAAEIYRLHADTGGTDPAASYGLGTALLAAGDTGAGADLLRAAEVGDSAVAQRAHYNLGILELGRAEAAAEPGQAHAALQAAVRHGWAALEMDPDDDDARWNLALAQLRLRELLRRTQNVEEDAGGDPQELAFDEGDLVRSEGADSALRPPSVPLPPSDDPGAPDEAERLRVAVEGAEEALAGDDPGPLGREAALALVRRGEDDRERLIRRLLWVHRPPVDWWGGEAYPGGGW